MINALLKKKKKSKASFIVVVVLFIQTLAILKVDVSGT